MNKSGDILSVYFTEILAHSVLVWVYLDLVFEGMKVDGHSSSDQFDRDGERARIGSWEFTVICECLLQMDWHGLW